MWYKEKISSIKLGMERMQCLWGQMFFKSKRTLPRNTALPLLGVCPREVKTHVHIETCPSKSQQHCSQKPKHRDNPKVQHPTAKKLRRLRANYSVIARIEVPLHAAVWMSSRAKRHAEWKKSPTEDHILHIPFYETARLHKLLRRGVD